MITSKVYLSIDAGGTFFKYSAFDIDGNILIPADEVAVDSKGDKDTVMAVYKEIFNRVSEKYEIAGVGISTPGPFDYVKRMSLMQHKFQSLYMIELGTEIENLFSKKIPVFFMSDSNAFLKGAYDGDESAVGITIGTGLGFSVCDKGEIITNNVGGPAEVIYNKPVNDKIAEDYVSGRGVVAEYQAKSGKSGLTAKKVYELAREGDEDAKEVFIYMGKVIGMVVKDYITKYNAKKFIIGGQVAKSFEFFADAIADELNMPVEIISAAKVVNPALVGVFREMKDKYIDNL